MQVPPERLERPTVPVLVAGACCLALVILLVFGLHKVSDLAEQGAETHAALCVYKQDLTHRYEDNLAFIALSREQRIEKYGEALGAIPTSVIQKSASAQRDTLKSLKTLNC